MKKINQIVLLLLIIFGSTVQAQDRANSYTNLLNPFLYNPALTGSYDNIYAVLNIRSIINGDDASPRSYNFGIHTPLKGGNALGFKVLAINSGVFQTYNTEATYSKTVKFTNKQTLSLGMSLGFVQTNIRQDLLTNGVDLSDQTLVSKDLNHMLLSSGAGFVYRIDKRIEAGVSFPKLVTGNQVLNSTMVANFAVNMFMGSKKLFKLKPIVNYYRISNSPVMEDLLLNASWNDAVSLQGGYRTNGSVIMSAGINLKSLAFNYVYYYHTGALMNLAPAQNEIAISFRFNKPQPVAKVKTEVVEDKVIQDEIDKINERLSGLINVEKTNPGLVNVKKEIVKLNKDLDKILHKYKITNVAQLKSIKELQNNLDILIAKYNND